MKFCDLNFQKLFKHHSNRFCPRDVLHILRVIVNNLVERVVEVFDRHCTAILLQHPPMRRRLNLTRIQRNVKVSRLNVMDQKHRVLVDGDMTIVFDPSDTAVETTEDAVGHVVVVLDEVHVGCRRIVWRFIR